MCVSVCLCMCLGVFSEDVCVVVHVSVCVRLCVFREKAR